MPLSLDNGKDLYGKAVELREAFEPRETLLARCERLLTIAPTQWLREQGVVRYEGEKAELLAQQHAATVRIATPFEVRLPHNPDRSAHEQDLVENTEYALQACWEVAAQEALRLRQHRAPQYDIGAYIVETGACAAMAYWRKNLKGDWRPDIRVYNSRYCYFESDDDGLLFYFISYTDLEARLAGLIKRKGWQSPYAASQTEVRNLFEVWAREGKTIYHAVVGEPSKTQEVMLKQPTEAPEWEEIPVLYNPAGGPVIRSSVPGGREGVFDQYYGQPFVAPALANMDTINYLGKVIVRTGLETAIPGKYWHLDNENAPKRVPLAQPGEGTIVDGLSPMSVNVVNANAIPYLQGQINMLRESTSQMLLPRSMVSGQPMPRSEILRRGLAEASLQALVPSRDCYGSSVAKLTENLRTGLFYLYDKGLIKDISLEIVDWRNQTGAALEKEPRTYTAEQLWRHGSIDVVLRPDQPREAILAGAQVYQILTQGQGDDPYLMEVLMGYRQPLKILKQRRRWRIYQQAAPAVELAQLDRDEQLLTSAELKMGRKEEISREESNTLLSIMSYAGMDTKLQDVTPQTIQFILGFIRRLRDDLQQRLIPESQKQKGQAPAASPTVSPEVEPSQGNPASGGFQGGGGEEDKLAALAKAQSGSDQPGGA